MQAYQIVIDAFDITVPFPLAVLVPGKRLAVRLFLPADTVKVFAAILDILPLDGFLWALRGFISILL